MQYRNVRHGRVVERHTADEWLEASAGWERLPPEPPPGWREAEPVDGWRTYEPEAEPATEADDDTPEPGDDERTE